MIKTKSVKIGEVKVNPNNPRLIRDDKFAKLVQSIKDLPQMLEIRPIVVNTDMVVLGGNMRLKACKEAGLKEVPIIIADNLTEDQQREFLIKDNVSGGDWDWNMIQSEWDTNELAEWGLDVPFLSNEYNSITDDDVDILEDFDPVGTSVGVQRVVFIFDGEEEAESYLNSLNVEFKKMNMAWQVNLSTKI
jgi:hypothetical protein